MTAELELHDDVLENFHQEQASGIGATDTPKILGLSRRGTPLSVYLKKIGETTVLPPSLPAWMGQKLQSTVAELYTAATGTKLRAAKQHYRHPQYHWLVCHLDYRAQGNSKLLIECKTRAYMLGWGEDGSDKIPADVWAQCQHEMMVTGAEQCDVAVLFGHHTFRIYHIRRNEEFIAALIPRLAEFWALVEAGTPPLPIGSDIDEAIVRARHPEVTEAIKSATPEQAAIVQQFLLARYNHRQAKAAEQEGKILLIDLIGGAEGITGPFGTITYRRSKDSTTIEWALVAESYRKLINELLKDIRELDPLHEALDAVDLDAIVGLYTTTEPGERRINVKENASA